MISDKAEEPPKKPSAAILEGCGEWITRWWNSAPPPDTLYHFTDTDGLAGILHGRAIWASLATSLDDCSEVQYGLDLAASVIEKRGTSAPSELLKAALRCLRNPHEIRPEFRYRIRVFVASFCESAEKSSHWMHYARRGSGFAIGFGPEIAIPRKAYLCKVEYERGTQERVLTDFLDRVQGIVTEQVSRPGADPMHIGQMAGHLVSVFLPALTVGFKAKSFSDDREWRLATLEVSCDGVPLNSNAPPDPAGIKFRTFQGWVIPYEEMPFPLPAVKEVLLGFSSPMNEHDDALRMLVEGVSPQLVPSRSTVPVR
jgi:hypothetical protein